MLLIAMNSTRRSFQRLKTVSEMQSARHWASLRDGDIDGQLFPIFCQQLVS